MGKKNLMIVESPAKAKTIEKYLGEDFVVKASFGHVRDLPKADDAIDVDHGFTPKYEVLSDKKDVIKELKKLAKEAQVVWLATDEDREGEAISWHLAEVLGLDPQTAKRVVFNEITKTAITKAVSAPRSINIDLVNAQQARRVLDRLVGFKLSPLLWSKVKTGLSAGRVQSVAVRIIVEREREIIAFVPTSAYRVKAEFDLGKGAVLEAELRKRPSTDNDLQAFLESCVGGEYSIKKLETRPGKKSPAAPFTTSTLQQEASRKLSFSVAQTMRVAQGLYEAGFITYMRTDSNNLSETAINQAGDVINDMYGANYHQPRQYKSKNSNAQEAHEAIRPTDLSQTDLGKDSAERRLYDLIWKRTIACQMANAITEKTTATIGISTSQEVLTATGEVLKFDGFLKVYIESRDEEDEDEKDDSGVLPPLAEGQILNLTEMVARERFTKHPPRYTEASLVKKLEELGIGRPSTYAPTISTIQRRNYVSKEVRDGKERVYKVAKLIDNQITHTTGTEITGAEKNKLFPTDLGMLVTDFLIDYFPAVLDYSFTAKVEEEFDEIATGGKAWNQMIEGFYGDFNTKVADTKENAERVNKERILGTDPKTGKRLSVRFGKYGPFAQIGDQDDPDKKYASLRSNQRLETITVEEALDLFKLPRIIGQKDGVDIKVNIGRYGPYVQLAKKFYSIPKDEDPYSIALDRALEIIAAKDLADANKIIHQFNDDVTVLNGRWGPYIKAHGKNIKIPKGTEAKDLTLEDCLKLYEEQKDKPKGRRKGTTKKKTAASSKKTGTSKSGKAKK